MLPDRFQKTAAFTVLPLPRPQRWMTSMISPLILLLWIFGFCRTHPLLPLSPKPCRKWLKSQMFHLRAGKTPALQITALLSVRQLSARLPTVRPANLPIGNPLRSLLCLLHRLQTLPGESRHLQDRRIPLLQVLSREPRFLIIMKPDPYRLRLLRAGTMSVPTGIHRLPDRARPLLSALSRLPDRARPLLSALSRLPDRARPLLSALSRLPDRARPLPTRLRRLPDRARPLPTRLRRLPPGAVGFPIAKQVPRQPKSVLPS